jgi:exosome complex RNA-binding protein Rrp42 (RNase PH superfamily)
MTGPVAVPLLGALHHHVAALLPDALHLPVVAALMTSTVEVVEGVTAIETMTVTVTVTGAVMSAALMIAPGSVMMTAVEIGVMIAVIGAMMVVDGVLTVHLPNMLTLIVKSARSMDTLPVIVGGAILMTRIREMMLRRGLTLLLPHMVLIQTGMLILVLLITSRVS